MTSITNPLSMTPKQRDEQAAQFAQLLKIAFAEVMSPQQKDMRRLRAIEQRERYLENVKAGFTEQQALELCKS